MRHMWHTCPGIRGMLKLSSHFFAASAGLLRACVRAGRRAGVHARARTHTHAGDACAHASVGGRSCCTAPTRPEKTGRGSPRGRDVAGPRQASRYHARADEPAEVKFMPSRSHSSKPQTCADAHKRRVFGARSSRVRAPQTAKTHSPTGLLLPEQNHGLVSGPRCPCSARNYGPAPAQGWRRLGQQESAAACTCRRRI